ISVAMGSLAVRNWPGTVVLAVGLAIGRIARHTGLGSFIADVALVPVLAATRGKHGARTGAVVVALPFAKRLAGNPIPHRPTWRHWLERLVFDRDPVDRSVSRQTGGTTTGRHL